MTATDAQVFDALHSAYGVGPDPADEPWFKFRAGQIGMIRRVREARKVDADDLFLAVEYARSQGRDVRHFMALFELISEARAWRLRRERVLEGERLDLLLGEAAALEMEGDDPDGEWVRRLVRATGPSRAEVYAEWLEVRRCQ